MIQQFTSLSTSQITETTDLNRRLSVQWQHCLLLVGAENVHLGDWVRNILFIGSITIKNKSSDLSYNMDEL